MKVFSDVLLMDSKYAYGKGNVSIPVEIVEAPANVKSFVIIFHDLHPLANDWVHWAVINIPSNINKIEEGISNTINMPGIELFNSFDIKGYSGPCPPTEDGIHEYQLSIFAMDIEQLDRTKFYNPNYLGYKQLKDLYSTNILSEVSVSGFYKN